MLLLPRCLTMRLQCSRLPPPRPVLARLSSRLGLLPKDFPRLRPRSTADIDVQWERYEAFYETPRLVYHIDDDAVAATTAFYDATFRDVARQRGSSKLDVLDLCSSWVSHYPAPAASSWQLGRVAGLGMNAEELQRNERLTEWTVRDLNKDARMPYAAERYVLRLPADR